MKDKNKERKKRIIDLSRFINAKANIPQENGMHTGMPDEYYYDGVENEPLQDGDDY